MVLATLWAVCDTAVASHPNKTFVVFNLLFVFLPMLHSLQDISFPNRDQTQPLAVKVQSPNHWTTREFPETCFLKTSDRNQSGWKIISLAGDILPVCGEDAPRVKSDRRKLRVLWCTCMLLSLLLSLKK